MNAIFSFDFNYLIYFFAAIFAASFALPTGAMIVIVSFASVATSFGNILSLFILATAAAISGDYSAYLMARFFKVRLDRYVLGSTFLRKKAASVDGILEKYGTHAIFLTRFVVSGLGPYVNLFSGLRGLSQLVFIRAVILGEIIYVSLFMAVGYFFSDTWQDVIKIVKDYTVFVALIFVGLLVAYRLIMLVKNEKS